MSIGTVAAGIFINGNETNHFGFGPTNIHIRYNIVNVNTVHGSIRIYDGSSGKDPKDIKIYGNIVYNNTLNAGLLIDTDLGNSNTLRVYNNIFYNTSVSINNSAATFPVFEFRNNVIYYIGAIPLTDSGRITAHSNNIYYGSGTLVRSNGTNYTAGNLGSYEPTASAANPQFVNTANLPTGFAGTYGVRSCPEHDGIECPAGFHRRRPWRRSRSALRWQHQQHQASFRERLGHRRLRIFRRRPIATAHESQSRSIVHDVSDSRDGNTIATN